MEPGEEAVRALDLPVFEMAGPAAAGTIPQDDGDGKVLKEKGKAKEESLTHPFIVGAALPVVPAKLVRKILTGEFIDMSDLLKDNMESERRRRGTDNSGTPSAGTTSRREVPDILSWLHCFSLYAAVICDKYPQKARELWAYQAMMIAENRRCGGRGWLLYDTAFRQQVWSIEKTDFSQLNQALYSTTFLAYGGKGQFCSRCLASDHTQDDCALHPTPMVPWVRLKDQARGGRREDRHHHETRRNWKGPCYAWNDGRCTAPYCRFEHVCSRCGGDHKRRVCKGHAPEMKKRCEE